MPLGRWAIDEALATLAAWDAHAGGDCGVNVAVNLSAIQLHATRSRRWSIRRSGVTDFAVSD